ncbi:MAG: radical SAM protein [Pseudomonadota bacterium]|nr:radical SAM protein [Pseudomonadota bacterium]
MVHRMLSITDHNRDSAGLTYVYPVVSRRAQGLSIGINLNTNNACNWACIYCQVPGLVRGKPAGVDLVKLKKELSQFLREVLFENFLENQVPEWARRLNDIALSGNGEPTMAREFEEVIEVLGQTVIEFDLLGRIKVILITNGSQIHRVSVQSGLRQLGNLGGEVWFKLDRTTREGMISINGVNVSPNKVRDNLSIAASLCPTWLQSCFFAIDNAPPSVMERQAYLEMIRAIKDDHIPVSGILLYGLARPSMQPEAARLSNLDSCWMESLAREIKELGFPVKISY